MSSSKSTVTAMTCSSITGADRQQSSLNFQFGKAEDCIKQLEEMKMEQVGRKLLTQKLQDAKQITSGMRTKK